MTDITEQARLPQEDAAASPERRDFWIWPYRLVVVGVTLTPLLVSPSGVHDGPLYLLAIAGLIACPLEVKRGGVVRLAATIAQIAFAAAVGLGLTFLIAGSTTLWGRIGGPYEWYRNPASICFYAIEMPLIYFLWRRFAPAAPRVLLVGIGSLLAMVQFDMAGSSSFELVPTVVLLGLAFGTAVAAVMRGYLITGAGLAVIASEATLLLYANAATLGWGYHGFWHAEVI
jgi:hypothetical protein